MNITEGIWRNSYASPDRLAVLLHGRAVTYAALRNVADIAGIRLGLAGVSRGDIVAVAIANPLGYLSVALALARMGATSTPLKAGLQADVKQGLVQRHGVKWLVHDANEGWRSPSLAPDNHIAVDALYRALEPGQRLAPPPAVHDVDDEPWHIALSGIAGTPQGNPQTHARCLLTYTLGNQSVHAPECRTLIFGDLANSMMFGEAIRSLLSGSSIVLALQVDPQAFFRLVERDKPTRVLTSTGIAAKILAYAQSDMPDSLPKCASVKAFVTAGSRMPAALERGLVTRVCPVVQINYGWAETGPIAVDEGSSVNKGRRGLRLRPWIEGEATDERGEALPPGQNGVLRFKSVFRDSWFYPGERGAIDEAGYLTLEGRVNSAQIVHA